MSAGGKIYRVRFESFDDFLVEYGDRLREGRLGLPDSGESVPNQPVRIKLQLPDGEVCYLKGRTLADVEDGSSGPAEVVVRLAKFSDKTRAKLERCVHSALSQQQERLPPRDARAMQLLLVDDMAAVRLELGDALRDRGVRVRVAENGLAAISAALKRMPDIILSDVEMPVMDGWTLLRMVRARARLANIPFVFFTRLDDDLSRLQGYRMGVDDYLAKDTTADEVLARIQAVIARQRRAPVSPADTGSEGLRGDLRHVRLGSLLSFLESERRTGALVLDDGTQRVKLTLVRGALYDVDDLGPFQHVRDRVFELLDWTYGEFELLPTDAKYAENISLTPLTYLLLEHARRRDESEAPC